MTDTILSNKINSDVYLFPYNLDVDLVIAIDDCRLCPELPEALQICEYKMVRERRRRPQTCELLQRLEDAIRPCRHEDWLRARGVVDMSDIYSIDYDALSTDDLLDLYLYPDDHILDSHGMRYVDGPVFLDRRDSLLAGVCVRNVSTDLKYVSDAKYTFSNYGWYLYGCDDCQPDDNVFLVEGVFDAIALRRHGYAAVAFGSCDPQPMQLACLVRRFHQFTICCDNDIHGHFAAYMISKIINAPICFTELKDPGCYLEHNSTPKLNYLTQLELRDMLVQEITERNVIIAAGTKFARPLPYNG
jgi:Toprim-like